MERFDPHRGMKGELGLWKDIKPNSEHERFAVATSPTRFVSWQNHFSEGEGGGLVEFVQGKRGLNLLQRQQVIAHIGERMGFHGRRKLDGLPCFDWRGVGRHGMTGHVMAMLCWVVLCLCGAHHDSRNKQAIPLFHAALRLHSICAGS